MKRNFVVSDELTITVPGLGLQPGSGHSCAVELRQGERAARLCIHPRQFSLTAERHCPHSPYGVAAGPCLLESQAVSAAGI